MADLSLSTLHIDATDQKHPSSSAAVAEAPHHPAPSAAPGLSTPPAALAGPRCSEGQPAGPAAVGIIYCAVTELHELADHAECPARTISIKAKLQQEGLLAQCMALVPQEATTEELLMAHTAAHIRKIDELFRPGVTLDDHGQVAELEGDALIISGDIYCTQHTSRAARAAAGCAVQAVQRVLDGTVQRAFAVVRPPGHHAESDGAMGFCLYNNVAVAAHAALQCPGIQRVLVLDWDVHHGNGSQQIFESDPRVLVISLHRRDSGFYPVGVGYASEVGSGPGRGFNVNVPWAAKGVGDADFMAAFELLVMPIAAAFDPQLVLVSAGFDAAEGDPLGQCKASPEGFGHMAQQLMGLARGKVVCVLEGGYNTRVISECAAEVVRVLLGQAPGPMLGKTASRMHKTTPAVLAEVHQIQQQFWPILRSATPMEQRVEQFVASLQLQALTLRIPTTRTPSSRTPATSHSAADALAEELGGLSVGENSGRVPRPKPVLSSSKRPPSARQAAAAAVRAAASGAAVSGAAATGAAASSQATNRTVTTSSASSSRATSSSGAAHAGSSAAPRPVCGSAQTVAASGQAPVHAINGPAAASTAATGNTNTPAAAMTGNQPFVQSASHSPASTSSMAARPSHSTPGASAQPVASIVEFAPAGAGAFTVPAASTAVTMGHGRHACGATSGDAAIASAAGALNAERGGAPITSAPAASDSAYASIGPISPAPDAQTPALSSTTAHPSTSGVPAPGGAAGVAGAAVGAIGAAAAGVAGAMAATAGAVGAALAAVSSAAVAGAAAVVERGTGEAKPEPAQMLSDSNQPPQS